MLMYLLLLIAAASIPFFIYCLWHVVRELTLRKSHVRELSD